LDGIDLRVALSAGLNATGGSIRGRGGLDDPTETFSWERLVAWFELI
jgi:hypothetical protein